MSTRINIKGKMYRVRDWQCIGRSCLELGCWEQKRIGSFGETHEGLKVWCCLREMREGCLSPLPSHDAAVAQQRKHPLFFSEKLGG
jgi:hypothetical protein